jgi:hypothetical protein
MSLFWASIYLDVYATRLGNASVFEYVGGLSFVRHEGVMHLDMEFPIFGKAGSLYGWATDYKNNVL